MTTAAMIILLWYTDKKEKKIFLRHKEIQMGAFAVTPIREGLPNI